MNIIQELIFLIGLLPALVCLSLIGLILTYTMFDMIGLNPSDDSDLEDF